MADGESGRELKMLEELKAQQTIIETSLRFERALETITRTRDLLRSCGVQTDTEDAVIARYEKAICMIAAARKMKRGAARREAVRNALRMAGGEL